AYFDDALKRLSSLPDTEANRLRRIDAVVKQAEVKFALGRQAEHIQALEGICEVVEVVSDVRRRAAWYYWTGFLHSLTSAPPQVAIGYCRQAAAIADGAGLDDMKAFTECCLAQVCAMAGELEDGVGAGEHDVEY